MILYVFNLIWHSLIFPFSIVKIKLLMHRHPYMYSNIAPKLVWFLHVFDNENMVPCFKCGHKLGITGSVVVFENFHLYTESLIIWHTINFYWFTITSLDQFARSFSSAV